MAGSVQVDPAGLAELGAKLAELAEEVRAAGRDLTGVGGPLAFGESLPSYESWPVRSIPMCRRRPPG